MFEEFFTKYKAAERIAFANEEPERDETFFIADPSSLDFFKKIQGCSFNGGLYTVLRFGEISEWAKMVEFAFPEYEGKVACFAYDWLGNFFALELFPDHLREANVLFFEIGTGHVYKTTKTFKEFHEVELCQRSDMALSESFYLKWRETKGRDLSVNECVGYRVPLFLGGKDVVDNLEISNLSVYWSLCAQMLNKTRYLPDGAKIGILT